jgi:hypothetical protein
MYCRTYKEGVRSTDSPRFMRLGSL